VSLYDTCPHCRPQIRGHVRDPHTGEVVTGGEVLTENDLAEWHEEHAR
jgi:hypothetical protein